MISYVMKSNKEHGLVMGITIKSGYPESETNAEIRSIIHCAYHNRPFKTAVKLVSHSTISYGIFTFNDSTQIK